MIILSLAQIAFLVAKVAGVSVLLVVVRALARLLHTLLVAPRLDPLKDLPGPDASFFQNQLSEVQDPDYSPDTHRDWCKKYGKTFRFQGQGKFDRRLMSFDLRVVSHVLNSPAYEKPWQMRSVFGPFLGEAVFLAEGATHKHLRKIIGPAFTTQAVKALTPTFFQKAEDLCERWGTAVDSSSGKGERIDLLHWLARATFDAFGHAGFDYDFSALDNENEPVYAAYQKIFETAMDRTVAHILIPSLDWIWPDKTLRSIKKHLKVIHEAGHRLIAAKKAALISDPNSHKDLLSILIKSNLSSDHSNRLTDSALIDQLSSFLFAGSDSTAAALAWCFHYLSLNPEIQTRLRQEIITACHMKDASDSGFEDNAPSDAHSSNLYEAFSHLPYLDAVVKETLRIASPVHGSIRVATRDDCIPVSHPVTLQDGTIVNPGESIRIKKGSFVHIPVEGLNYDEDIWGGDSRAFNPNRWTSLPEKAKAPTFPGLANVMCFSFGPHSCPGFKLTILEMKAFLAVIIPQFTFHPVEGQRIGKYNDILMRPFVKGKLGEGVCLPMVVRRYEE